jgi:multidrug efflux pump subunit AcrB
MFSAFFINRPRFAIVVSVVLILLGLLALAVLPVAQYPEITPPQIVVSTNYIGANAQVLADTVAIPIENEINGVDNMLYMSSSSDDNGKYTLTVTFEVGTDADIAQVKVQNRLQQVTSELPEEVNQYGVNVSTQNANMLAMLVLRSPHHTYDDLFLSNYAYTNLKNALSRVKGVGDVNIFGPQYSMRIWLDSHRLNALGLTSSDVMNAVRT